MKQALLALAAAATLSGATCESLKTLALPHTTITLAEAREPGSFTPPLNNAKPIDRLPAFCRVAGSIAPTSDSDIRFEVWLPANWNGKFEGVGNGGFAGIISYAGLADSVRNGYATASTDTGHQETHTSPNAEWALHHPEKVVDFGHRAIHETAVQAKSIIQNFYGDAPKRSYFDSCSNGGRQALMEAQRYPADYDGIIAGAPANYWSHLLAGAASGMRATLAEPQSYISSAKLPAIEAAALAQCDAADGVKDGVIENPLACHFDTSVLKCKGAETDSCLTQPQLIALNTLYGGMKSSKGQQLFPGLSPGGEAEQGGWEPWITGKTPNDSLMYWFGTQYFQNIVFSDPNWRFQSFDPDRDTKASDDKGAKALNSNDPDLGSFARRGGKLIMYHGWSDAAISPTNAVDYYRSVQKKMTAAQTDSFLRLYMIPGMEHCGGGAGPNPLSKHTLDKALEAWVEQGSAPAEIVATKYGERGETLRTRPVCPWPQVAKWKGSGSTDDAANFTCAAP